MSQNAFKANRRNACQYSWWWPMLLWLASCSFNRNCITKFTITAPNDSVVKMESFTSTSSFWRDEVAAWRLSLPSYGTWCQNWHPADLCWQWHLNQTSTNRCLLCNYASLLKHSLEDCHLQILQHQVWEVSIRQHTIDARNHLQDHEEAAADHWRRLSQAEHASFAIICNNCFLSWGPHESYLVHPKSTAPHREAAVPWSVSNRTLVNGD